MPKKIYKFPGYHGGINDVDNPKDITEVELQEAQDVRLDKFGKIIPWGRGMLHDAGGPVGTSLQNQGLFVFSSDRQFGDASSEAGENWMAVGVDDYMGGTVDTSGVALYYESGDTWNLTEIVYSDSNFKPVFYYVDGALRFSDSRITATTDQKIAKWYGYIKRDLYYDSDGAQLTPGGTAVSYDGWELENQAISPPTRGVFGIADTNIFTADASGSAINLIKATAFTDWESEIDAGEYNAVDLSGLQRDINSWTSATTVVTDANTANWDGKAVWIATDAGLGFTLKVTATGTSGTWPAGDYIFGSTFIYDGTQESLIFEMAGTEVAIAATESIAMSIIISTPYNKRITGGRIYCKVKGSPDSWGLLADISLKDGVKTSLTGEYTDNSRWTEAYANSPVMISIVQSDDPNLETYEILNGFSVDQEDIGFAEAGMGYKFAVVSGNRKSYIANIRLKDPEGESITKSDMMIASPTNRFDTFLWDNRVEVAIDDGDEITGLVYFADRILQFKRNRLYIINVSQDIEFLESTHEHAGARGQHAICKFEDGVLWVNDHGIYLYDGERVIDVTLNQKTHSRRLNWGSDYYDDINNVAIGYHPTSKIAVITLDTDELTSSDALLFHLPTGAFTFGSDKLRSPIAWLGQFETDTDSWVNADMTAMVRNTTTPISGDGDLKFTSDTNDQYIKKAIPFPATEGFRYRVYLDYRVESDTAFEAYIGDSTGTDWSGTDVINMTSTSNASTSGLFEIQIPAASAGDTGDAYLIIKSNLTATASIDDNFESYANTAALQIVWDSAVGINTTLNTSSPLSGTQDLYYRTSVKGYNAYHQTGVTLYSGSEYTLSYNYKTANSDRWDFYLATSKKTNVGRPASYGWFPHVAVTPQATKTFYTITFTATSTETVYPNWYDGFSSAGVSIWIDDFQIVPTAATGGFGWIDNLRIEPYFGTSGDYPVISNFTNDWDGKLIYTLKHPSSVAFGEETILTCYYDPDEYSASTPKFITKDIEFNAPDNKKNIYQLNVIHKGCGSANVSIYYRSDGAGSWTSAGTLADSDTLVRESFSVSVKNIYSLEVKVEASDVIESGWQIDSISVVERTKNAGR